jgi:aminomethyltransferase
VNAANLDKDYRWIKDNSEGFIVNIVNDSDNWGQLAIQGRDSEAILGKVLARDLSSIEFYRFIDTSIDGKRAIISRTGYTGEDGFEVYAAPDAIVNLWKALLAAGVTPCGLGCRDTLRFEAGLPLYGHEISQEISPVVAGLGMFCNMNKLEFIGKDAIAAQKAEAPAQKIVGIELADKAIPRADYPVLLEDGTVVGKVTTGYRSISLDKSICFALVERSVGAMGATLYIQIHRKVLPGTVVKKRFYQTNYKK